ncbi:MAG: hypothetical protein JXR78_08010 [Victivallales bacterium]|nr:hypothetical protein [Victivallales bacterium]
MKALIIAILLVASASTGIYFFVKHQVEQEEQMRTREQATLERIEAEMKKAPQPTAKATSKSAAPGFSTRSKDKFSNPPANRPSGPLSSYRPVQRINDSYNTHNQGLKEAGQD